VSQIAERNTPSRPGTLAGHHPIGVSTGVFDDLRGAWRQLVVTACKVSTYAVELSALSEDELPGLIAYLAGKPRLPFRYVSVHAPVKNRAVDDATAAPILDQLPLWVRSIVTHPDALHDFGPYRELGTRLVLENMDDRKSSGRTADELEVVFAELPDAGFCFDVAHAYSIDPTMAAAHDLLDRFPARLRQVHLSSLAAGHHVPLTEDDEALFAATLERCSDVPWILEARPPARWLAELKAAPMTAVG
jgi:sugar phosphate isomerase/epimerase